MGDTASSDRARGPEYRVPAVERAFDLLELLVSERDGLTLSEISRGLDIPKSSAHYLVECLCRRGYLWRAWGHRYLLGVRAGGLGEVKQAASQFAQAALPHLTALAKRFGLCACACVLGCQGPVIIAKANAAVSAALGPRLARRVEPCCNAAGKALIAEFFQREPKRAGHKRNPAAPLVYQLVEAHFRTPNWAGPAEEIAFTCIAAPLDEMAGGIPGGLFAYSTTGSIPEWKALQIGRCIGAATKDISRAFASLLRVDLEVTAVFKAAGPAAQYREYAAQSAAGQALPVP